VESDCFQSSGLNKICGGSGSGVEKRHGSGVEKRHGPGCLSLCFLRSLIIGVLGLFILVLLPLFAVVCANRQQAMTHTHLTPLNSTFGYVLSLFSLQSSLCLCLCLLCLFLSKSSGRKGFMTICQGWWEERIPYPCEPFCPNGSFAQKQSKAKHVHFRCLSLSSIPLKLCSVTYSWPPQHANMPTCSSHISMGGKCSHLEFFSFNLSLTDRQEKSRHDG